MANTEQSAEKIEEPAPVDLVAELPDFAELLPAQLQPSWRVLDAYPVLQAIVISMLFLGLAYVIRRYFLNIVKRQLSVHMPKLMDTGAVGMLSQPVFSTVVCVGIVIALSSSGLTEGVLRFIIPILGSFLVLIWLGVSFRLVDVITRAMSASPRMTLVNERSEPLLSIVFKILVLIVGTYALFIVWGINPVGVLASAGIAGLAFGFAAKDTLANLFSGFFIIADRPYKLGDYVNLDSGERGKVTHIGLRSTRILTRDDIEVIIPNGVIGNAKIVNETGGPSSKMRLRLNVQASYDADLDHVCNVLMDVANSHPGVCEFPQAKVRVRGFATNGVNIELLCWIDEPELRGRTLHELYLSTRKAFREHNLEIPYPKQDVYFQNAGLTLSDRGDEP